MRHGRRKKEITLSPLSLEILSGFEPVRPTMSGIPCATCGRDDVSLTAFDSVSGGARLVCEPCAVNEFRKEEGYESHEAAKSARRRSLETPLLFAELAIRARAKSRGLASPFEVSPKERADVIRNAHQIYQTALSFVERREIETLPEQRLVEGRLEQLLRFIEGEGGKDSVGGPHMSFTFSRTEYERLLVMAYLGNFMINGLFKERNQIYDDLLSKVFSRARDGGLGRYVSESEKTHVPSSEFGQHPDVRRYRKEYEEEIFWDELIRRLADRDMRADRGAAFVSRLSPKQYDELIVFYEAVYVEEFDRFGVKRMRVNDEDQPSDDSSFGGV